MMNQNNTLGWVGLMAFGLAAVPMTMSGCGKKPPPPPPPPAPDVAPPPLPPQADVAALLQEMDADSRVLFPEEVAPIDVDYARAIISFASSFAQGDEEALRGMLDLGGQQTLDALVETGAWYDATDSIEAVLVVYLTEPIGDEGSDAMGDIGTGMDDVLSAESFRDEMLRSIREDEDVTIEDILGDMGLANPQAIDSAHKEAFEGLMEEAGMQMVEQMFGPELFAQIAELEKEVASGEMSPEDLVNAMYDRGILATMAEKMGAIVGSMGAVMDQIGSAFGMDTGGAELRLAIQEPGAAYALSFTARNIGGRFIFSPAPEENIILVRATDFTGKSAGIGSFGDSLGDLGSGDLFGNPDGRSSDRDSTQGGGGDSPTRPNVPTGPGPSSPGG